MAIPFLGAMLHDVFLWHPWNNRCPQRRYFVRYSRSLWCLWHLRSDVSFKTFSFSGGGSYSGKYCTGHCSVFQVVQIFTLL